MSSLLGILSVLLVLLNFRLLGTSRLAACIQTAALQGVVLGILALLANAEPSLQVVAIVIAATFIKGWALPTLIRRSAREAGVQQDTGLMVGFTTSLLIGAGLLAVCISIGHRLHLPSQLEAGLLVPIALFTVFCGLFLIIFRRTAVMQVLGYLVMENGIYLFGMAFAVHEPFLVEMGVLLDVLAAVFVMGIAIYYLSQEFDHVDTNRMSAGDEP